MDDMPFCRRILMLVWSKIFFNLAGTDVERGIRTANKGATLLENQLQLRVALISVGLGFMNILRNPWLSRYLLIWGLLSARSVLISSKIIPLTLRRLLFDILPSMLDVSIDLRKR